MLHNVKKFDIFIQMRRYYDTMVQKAQVKRPEVANIFLSVERIQGLR